MVYLMKLAEDGPATKKDLHELGDKLVWPPEFTRDSKLKKMQSLLDQENAVMNDPSLSDTEKVLRVGELKRQFNVYKNNRPMRLAAVPPVPLIEVSDDEEDEDLPEQSELHADELLKPVAAYRRAKAKLMLKKLANAGLLKWDSSGNVFFRGKPVQGANMGQLVHYFQTAHRREPIDPPVGQMMFSHALRHAGAMEDVQLGGKEDEQVRQVFRGITPKTSRLHPYTRVYKDKTVQQLEF